MEFLRHILSEAEEPALSGVKGNDNCKNQLNRALRVVLEK